VGFTEGTSDGFTLGFADKDGSNDGAMLVVGTSEGISDDFLLGIADMKYDGVVLCISVGNDVGESLASTGAFKVGYVVATVDGEVLAFNVGLEEDCIEGTPDGEFDGTFDGESLALNVGLEEERIEGIADALLLGSCDGFQVGYKVGSLVGDEDGEVDGATLGFCERVAGKVGAAVGASQVNLKSLHDPSL